MKMIPVVVATTRLAGYRSGGSCKHIPHGRYVLKFDHARTCNGSVLPAAIVRVLVLHQHRPRLPWSRMVDLVVDVDRRCPVHCGSGGIIVAMSFTTARPCLQKFEDPCSLRRRRRCFLSLFGPARVAKLVVPSPDVERCSMALGLWSKHRCTDIMCNPHCNSHTTDTVATRTDDK